MAGKNSVTYDALIYPGCPPSSRNEQWIQVEASNPDVALTVVDQRLLDQGIVSYGVTLWEPETWNPVRRERVIGWAEDATDYVEDGE